MMMHIRKRGDRKGQPSRWLFYCRYEGAPHYRSDAQSHHRQSKKCGCTWQICAKWPEDSVGIVLSKVDLMHKGHTPTPISAADILASAGDTLLAATDAQLESGEALAKLSDARSAAGEAATAAAPSCVSRSEVEARYVEIHSILLSHIDRTKREWEAAAAVRASLFNNRLFTMEARKILTSYYFSLRREKLQPIKKREAVYRYLMNRVKKSLGAWLDTIPSETVVEDVNALTDALNNKYGVGLSLPKQIVVSKLSDGHTSDDQTLALLSSGSSSSTAVEGAQQAPASIPAMREDEDAHRQNSGSALNSAVSPMDYEDDADDSGDDGSEVNAEEDMDDGDVNDVGVDGEGQ